MEIKTAVQKNEIMEFADQCIYYPSLSREACLARDSNPERQCAGNESTLNGLYLSEISPQGSGTMGKGGGQTVLSVGSG